MQRELVNFMNEKDIEKDNNSSIIKNKDVSLFNIKSDESGIYFSLRINDEYNKKEIQNLFIPAKFFIKNNNNTKQEKKVIKSTFVAYFIIYPLAILSLGLIFATIFKYLPNLQNLFEFSLKY